MICSKSKYVLLPRYYSIGILYLVTSPCIIMLTRLVSDSIVDTFVVVYKFAFDFFHFSSHSGSCNLLYSSIAVTLIIGSLLSVFLGGKISVQYISLNFSILGDRDMAFLY